MTKFSALYSGASLKYLICSSLKRLSFIFYTFKYKRLNGHGNVIMRDYFRQKIVPATSLP